MQANDNALRNLRAFAKARIARGDNRLVLSPVPTPQEQFEPPDEYVANLDQGLVLEPSVGSAFEARALSPRQGHSRIAAFCDGIRSTYYVGHEDLYPVLFARNMACVRIRRTDSGYHDAMPGMKRQQSTLLAPFGMMDPTIRTAYERFGLCPTRLSDLCWIRPDGDEQGITPSDMPRLGNLSWQVQARRRARHLMELSEQIVALAGAAILREQDATGSNWLLKDGSLFQFDRAYLKERDCLRQVVSSVKTHPVSFFGIPGERMIAALRVGERSVAFLPRPVAEAKRQPPRTLLDTARPMVSWYLRVHEQDPLSPSPLSGVIRLDIAATNDWQQWIDEVSWAVLDEFYNLSALPDPRYDVMPYGVFDAEQYMKAQEISGDLLLAQLA